MLARDIMTHDVISVRPETPVEEVARLLLVYRISGAPVVDASGRVVGVVTEADLIVRERPEAPRSRWLRWFGDPDLLAAAYVKSHGVRAEEIMSRPAVCITEEIPVEAIAALLQDRGINRVPVLREGRLVGIVSREDLLKALVVQPSLRLAPPDDAELRRRALAQLEREDWATIAGLWIGVDRGVVEIWGIVETPAVREAVTVALENVAGVRRIFNRLTARTELPAFAA